MERVKQFYNRDPLDRFWLHITISAAVIWALGGLVSILPLGTAAMSWVSVVTGVAACWILVSALLCLAEKRAQRQKPGKKQWLLEIEILMLMLGLQVLSEIIAVRTGTVSYAPMVTLALLGVIFCLWIVEPRRAAGEKCSTGDILKILAMGIFSCVLLGQFVAALTEIFV